MVGFNCYIDESGDEGINTGGTRWFILGAVIVSDQSDLQVSSMIPRIREKLGREKNNVLHWSHIRNHDKKLYICSELLTENWKFSCVVTDKTDPFIAEAGGLSDKWNLYNYSTRLLLERLSWYARDNGGGKAKLIFEQRSNLSYLALGDYLEQLHDWDPPTNVSWDNLDWQNFEVIQKGKSRLLQVADIVCGTLSNALEFSNLGNIEPRYVLTLKDHFYRRGSNLFSYGLKFLHVRGNALSHHRAEYPWLESM